MILCEIYQKIKIYNEVKLNFEKYLIDNVIDYVVENKYDFSIIVNDSKYFEYVKLLGEYGNIGNFKE